jgi:lysozyme
MTAPVTTISEAGLRMLQHFEGFREKAYQDVVGVWTVGFGETQIDGRPVRAGDVLPRPAAEARLRARCDGSFGTGVRSALGAAARDLSQHQYDALVCLAYNIGVGGFRTSTVAKKLIAGDAVAAGAAFLLWNRGGGRVLPVLVVRRRVERACFDLGKYPA